MKALERAQPAATSVWFRATPSNRPLVYEQSLPGTRRIPLRRGSEAATRPIGATDWPRDFQPRLWKFLNQADDRGRVIKQSIFKIENSVFNSLCLFLVGRAVIGSMLDVRCSMFSLFIGLDVGRWCFPCSSGSIFDVGCFLCPSENCSFSAILISG